MLLLFAALGHAGTWELVRERRLDGAPVTPTSAERLAYATLVRDLARAAPAGRLPPDAPARAAALGLELLRNDDVAWLVERGEPRGVGLVALRVGPLAEDLVLQAPHLSPTSTPASSPPPCSTPGSCAPPASPPCTVALYRWGATGLDPVPWAVVGGESEGPGGELGATLLGANLDGDPLLVVGAPSSHQVGLEVGAIYTVRME